MMFDKTFSRNAYIVAIGKFRLFLGQAMGEATTVRVAFTSEPAGDWADKQIDSMWWSWGQRQSYAVLVRQCNEWELEASKYLKSSGLRYELMERVNVLRLVMASQLNSMSHAPMGA